MIIWSYREVYPAAYMNSEVDTNQLLPSKLVEESEAAAGRLLLQQLQCENESESRASMRVYL